MPKDHRNRRDDRHSHHNPKRQRRNSSENTGSDIRRYKHELSRFLDEHCEIKRSDEFWRLFEKYEAKQKPDTFDRNLLLNLDFRKSTKKLYDTLPSLDRNGEKFHLNYETFKKFTLIVRVYQDFQQKQKFTKLKRLRTTQKELPIASYKEEILSKLRNGRVLLVAGDTGCGKSTQVPQYVLEAGYRKVVCTQPRRIACISLSKRVAFETLSEYKSTVGYQIRFERSKNKETSVIFMTEGLLLRQAAEEETLKSYDVVILDEVHERHLHGDFLVGIMKCLLHKRSDFKLILMSATINLELFTDYFAQENVATVQVPGRLYPIDIHYRPIIKDPSQRKRDRFDCTPYLQILQLIDEKYQPHQKGDLLIFLNGYSEISTLADAVNQYAEAKKNWIVLQLHSSLSLEEQDKVFDYPPDGVRKCIISTNIAETSVTIDGVRFVVDSGKVNRMTYQAGGGFNKLAETNISQDSAKQRAGRAGRTGPGVCYRLYSEDDLKSFDPFTPAEIHLVPLESLILHMISLGLTDISNFPFLEKPSAQSIEESIEKLKFCGALKLQTNYLQLTPLGEALSNLPVDLCLAKMLIMSTVFGNVNSILATAALLSVPNPLTQQATRDSEARDVRSKLESNHGDPLSLLNYYKEWLEVKQVSSGYGSSKSESSGQWARKRCLEEQRFYEATKLVDQFREILQEASLLSKIEESDVSSSDRAIRYGELKQLKALRYKLKNEARGSKRKKLQLHETDKEDKLDLRDVEFRITNDNRRLQKMLNENTSDSYKDLTLLKLILTSGLYPQVAVPDEHNTSKTVADKLYHTKSKNYVFLRPMSVFAMDSDILELHNDDIEVPPPGYFSRRPISRKHQLLVFQSILETKKVYLVNAMRMPALQTLLLFARCIATNCCLTKMVFDDFLAVDLPYLGEGKEMLLRAIQLRKKWNKKLEERLKDPTLSSKNNEREIFYFIEDLIKFTRTEVSYNMKRLLPADLKSIYTFETLPRATNKNPFDADYQITSNDEKGGVNVTENVVYGCLVQETWADELENAFNEQPFKCVACDQNYLGLSFFEALQHEVECKECMKNSDVVEETEETSVVVKGNSKRFVCDKCGKTLVLTPVEILRHKKSCT